MSLVWCCDVVLTSSKRAQRLVVTISVEPPIEIVPSCGSLSDTTLLLQGSGKGRLRSDLNLEKTRITYTWRYHHTLFIFIWIFVFSTEDVTDSVAFELENFPQFPNSHLQIFKMYLQKISSVSKYQRISGNPFLKMKNVRHISSSFIQAMKQSLSYSKIVYRNSSNILQISLQTVH